MGCSLFLVPVSNDVKATHNRGSCDFRSEQFFGSPTDTAAAAEGVRERLLLVEERRLQLQEARLHNDGDEREEEALNGQDARLDVIGEELSEKEDQDEEEEDVGQQDEDLERATQDC